MDYVYFKGKGSWFQHLFQFDDKFGKWSIQIHLTPESLDEFKALKLKTHLKMDDDGWYTKLSRPREKLTRGGKRLVFDQPLVFDKDMMPIRKGTNIGNGSDITCKCEVYQYTPPGSKNKENAIRLAEVRIDNLVPYNPDKDYTPEEAAAAEGLKDQPKPVF